MLKSRFTFVLIALSLLGYIFMTSPDIKFPLVLHKLSLVSIAAVVGYFLDVILFPNFRPHDWAKTYEHRIKGDDKVVAAILIRRAVVIVGVILGVSMGV